MLFNSSNTPVAFIIFNRSRTTQRVFDAIALARPPILLVVADGPRADHPEDHENCLQTRKIINNIDWKCEILTNFSDSNLGCKKRVSSGIDWVFEIVDRAIILEDDCLPHPSFFRYCDELLEYYCDDERIMSITGQNVQFEHNRTSHSYFFSRYFHCWGWASWRRAWQHYDLEMDAWPEIGDQVLDATFCNSRAKHYWKKILQSHYEGKYKSWGYSATFSFWAQSGLHIHPSVNLISNIGFGVGATNTKVADSNSLYANMKTSEMQFPLKHSSYIVPNLKADNFTQETHYNPSLATRVSRKIKQGSKKLIRSLD